VTDPAITVTCHPPATRTIDAAAASAYPRETGGLLLGWWDIDGIVVAQAIEVIDPAATTDSWSRSQDTAQPALDDALARLDDHRLGYVGDWHTHPQRCPASGTDLATISRASREYANPITLLVHQPPGTLAGHVAHRGGLRPVRIRHYEPGNRA
jgi:integrative and conjugative element protein (TIGR02256 family)